MLKEFILASQETKHFDFVTRGLLSQNRGGSAATPDIQKLSD